MAKLRKLFRFFKGLALGALPAFSDRPEADLFVSPKNRSRRFLLLAHLLSGSGLGLRVHWKWQEFQELNSKGYLAFSLPQTRLTTKSSSRSVLTVIDEGRSRPSCATPPKTLIVSYSTGELPDPLPPQTTFIPILFHPNLMRPRALARLLTLNSVGERSLGMFFSGNFDPKQYDRESFGTDFGMLNRYQIVQIVKEPEFREWLYEPESWEEFESARKQGHLRDRFVLIDSSVFTVPQDRWFSTLAETKYFLAPPGYTQPFCHNLVEAMAMGAVPVTNYGHLLRPRLQHDKTAILFSDADSLRVTLRMLKERSVSEFSDLNLSAQEYQRNYLSPQSVWKTLRAFLDDTHLKEWNLILAGGKQ